MPPAPPISLPVLAAPTAHVSRLARQAVPRRRWVIVEDITRRDVDEGEFRTALATCASIEVTHYPHDDVIAHVCYRTRS